MIADDRVEVPEDEPRPFFPDWLLSDDAIRTTYPRLGKLEELRERHGTLDPPKLPQFETVLSGFKGLERGVREARNLLSKIMDFYSGVTSYEQRVARIQHAEAVVRYFSRAYQAWAGEVGLLETHLDHRERPAALLAPSPPWSDGDRSLWFDRGRKLEALALKYYQGARWEPAVGEFYTLTRADLELFQILRTDGREFAVYAFGEVEGRFRIPEPSQETSLTFPVEGFATEGFGVNRVHVPSSLFGDRTAA